MSSISFCTYCHLEKATDREHVFPRSWYPANTPPTVQRLTVPSCRACNKKWQRVEETIGHDLLMICDADHPDVAGVVAQMMKGLDPSKAKSPKDEAARKRRALGVLETIRWEKPRADAAQAKLVAPDGTIHIASPCRAITRRALTSLAEKLVRGLYYGEGKGDLPLDAQITAMLIPGDGVRMAPRDEPITVHPILARALTQLPINDRMAPGLRYRWMEERGAMMWDFLLWGHVNIVALSMPALIKVAR